MVLARHNKTLLDITLKLFENNIPFDLCGIYSIMREYERYIAKKDREDDIGDIGHTFERIKE